MELFSQTLIIIRLIKFMKSDNYFISLWNKSNIVTYKNSTNNRNGDKGSGSDSGGDNYNVNKKKVMVRIKIR